MHKLGLCVTPYIYKYIMNSAANYKRKSIHLWQSVCVHWLILFIELLL